MRGNAQLERGDVEGALDLFMRSRGLVPSISNTTNAAICLERLDRVEEAIAMYEQLLAGFADRLTDEERRGSGAKIAELRRKLGQLEVIANVEGVLVIDGRRRGTVPLSAPLSLRAGPHTVRVLREGYGQAEAVVEVVAGQTARVELSLEALSQAGRLRVADAAKGEVEVVVDGSPVGPAPWEGTLAPGRHLVWLRGAEKGTAPREVNVLLGQTVPIELRSQPLGPTWRLEPSPRAARVSIDDVEIGAGPWEGRLPKGEHVFVVYEEGYVSRRHVFVAGEPERVTIELAVDEAHPRWQLAERPRLALAGFLGPAMGGGLGGGVDAACPGQCLTEKGVTGSLIGARVAYMLPVGLRVEGAVGYAQMSRSLTRTVSDRVTYRLDDDVKIAGPMASVSMAYAFPRHTKVRGVARLALGGYFAQVSDRASGVALSGQESVSVSVQDAGKATSGATVFLAPEGAVEISLGAIELGFGLGVGVFLVEGPRLSNGEVGPSTVPASCTGAELRCTRGSNVVAGERSFGRFAVAWPQVSVGHAF